MYQRPSKNTSVLVLVAIGAIATGLSIASYQYSVFTSEEIRKIGAQDARSNAEIQAHDIANNLKNSIEAVRSNLALLSSIPGIQNQDIESSKALFSDAQETTSNITSSYFWIDKDGKLLWANSFENQTIYEQYGGGDRSFRPYFTEPRDTLRPYFSSLIESVDAVPRLYIAHPIVLDTGQINNNSGSVFNGVVASAIDVEQFGQVLQAQLSSKYGSTLGMVDRNATILYSANATYVGKDVFGDEFQSVIPQEIRASFNSFLQRSLQGSAGSGDISLQGNTSTIAYEPASFSGDNFAVVYIVAPHNIQEAVGALIDQQRYFNLIVIGSIGAVAVGVAFLILNWNRRLSGIVKSKTAELEKANLSLQKALEQLKDHDRMQLEFINVAAHELRTPTQAIIGYSDLFYLRPESREESIKAISRNAERLESLTRDILDVTRIEGRRLDLNKEKFDISEVVASAIEDIRRRVDDSNIKFEYAPRKIVVQADRMRISQVISNLLGNAVKFTKQGAVYISADNKDGQVVVSVKDTGPGIDPEIMPRLFTKFTSKSQTGTGLGLFISKSIIEAHGGRIWAENNKDKKGATVAFKLPLET
ncbi:MAG: sensor histidine kinase [Thermoproteota archaeon]|nr:sensor histidine kinase [Thermoproteota archaeon]